MIPIELLPTEKRSRPVPNKKGVVDNQRGDKTVTKERFIHKLLSEIDPKIL